MIRPPTFIYGLLLVWLGTMPLVTPATAQVTATPTPTPTSTPKPTALYLPLILKQRDPCTDGPAPPMLKTPPDGITVTTEISPTLTWHAGATCAAKSRHYGLQIAIEADFNPDSLIYTLGYQGDGDSDEPWYEASSHTLSNVLTGTYYWRVAAFDDDDPTGPWSETHRLSVEPFIDQLLTNPSFENSDENSDENSGENSGPDIAPWQWHEPALTSTQVYSDPQRARLDYRYLAVNRQDSSRGNRSFYQEVGPPQAGTTYHFAIWVRASAEAVVADRPRTGRLDLWAFGGTAPREHSTHNFSINDTAWHCVETSLSVTGDDHAHLRAEVYLTSLDVFDYHFDYAVLRDDGQATCPPPPLDDGATLVSSGQGFDTCAAPPLSQMAAWKEASPYDYIGIYLGGINHYSSCKSYNQQYQTPAWFTEVAHQGWQFIPVWVGPQAACNTSYSIRHSLDPNLAWDEGVAEAEQAIQAAANLGLITAAKPTTIIYYDMEYYPPNDPTCHTAVNAFLTGWVSELQKRGLKAGIYGSAAITNDWYRLEHVPDSVWAASYIRDGYDPEMTINILNQSWISPGYWPNHRLHQYSNSHNETWGGVTMNIDNDVAQGLVALGGAAVGDNVGDTALQEARLVAPNQGWLWQGASLFWSDSGGATWREITPPTEGVAAVFFLDASHGWAVDVPPGPSMGGEPEKIPPSGGLGGPEPAPFRLWHTADGGQTWHSYPVGIDTDFPTGDISLDFVNVQTGWLVIEQATGPNFSRGHLFQTSDGGVTWTARALPSGGQIDFMNATTGWLVGGPTGSELYVTRDGGQTWQAQTDLAGTTVPVAYSLPVFVDVEGQRGSLAVTRYEGSHTRLERYRTTDGGQTWQIAETVTLAQPLSPGTTPPLRLGGSDDWLVADAAISPTLPPGTVALDFATATTGWSLVRENACTGDTCRARSRLFATEDGGQTWRAVALP